MKILGFEVLVRHYLADEFPGCLPWRVRVKLLLRRRKVSWVSVAYLALPLGECVGMQVVAAGRAYCSAREEFSPQYGELLAIRRAFRRFFGYPTDSDRYRWMASQIRERYFRELKEEVYQRWSAQRSARISGRGIE